MIRFRKKDSYKQVKEYISDHTYAELYAVFRLYEQMIKDDDFPGLYISLVIIKEILKDEMDYSQKDKYDLMEKQSGKIVQKGCENLFYNSFVWSYKQKDWSVQGKSTQLEFLNQEIQDIENVIRGKCNGKFLMKYNQKANQYTVKLLKETEDETLKKEFFKEFGKRKIRKKYKKDALGILNWTYEVLENATFSIYEIRPSTVEIIKAGEQLNHVFPANTDLQIAMVLALTRYKNFLKLEKRNTRITKVIPDSEGVKNIGIPQKLVDSNSFTDFCNSLKEYKQISNTTSITEMRNVFFNGRKPEPVNWTGKIGELTYLMRQIAKNEKLKSSLGRSIWEITTHCFLNKFGEKFSKEQLRTAKIPKDTSKVDRALNSLIIKRTAGSITR